MMKNEASERPQNRMSLCKMGANEIYSKVQCIKIKEIKIYVIRVIDSSKVIL